MTCGYTIALYHLWLRCESNHVCRISVQ